jgi:hypothetical protein
MGHVVVIWSEPVGSWWCREKGKEDSNERNKEETKQKKNGTKVRDDLNNERETEIRSHEWRNEEWENVANKEMKKNENEI